VQRWTCFPSPEVLDVGSVFRGVILMVRGRTQIRRGAQAQHPFEMALKAILPCGHLQDVCCVV